MQNHSVSPDVTGLPSFPITTLAGAADPSKSSLDMRQRRALGSGRKGLIPGAKSAPAEAAAPRIVLFRLDNPSAGITRITAVFPCEPAMDGQMLGFTVEEGHMTCARLWFDLSRPAQEGQYADLAARLRAKGHTLDIRHRITPAMDTTRAWRHAEALEAARAEAGQSIPEPVTKPAIRSIAKIGRAIMDLATGCASVASGALPIAYRADPLQPEKVVAAFVLALAADGGHFAYTMDGPAIVSEEWLKASVPARPVHAKAVAAKIRSELKVGISTRLEINEETRGWARNRRAMGFTPGLDGSREAYMNIGRALAFAVGAEDTVALVVAHSVYGVRTGWLTHAFGLDWEEVSAKLAAAAIRRATDTDFAADLTMAEDLAKLDLRARSSKNKTGTALAA